MYKSAKWQSWIKPGIAVYGVDVASAMGDSVITYVEPNLVAEDEMKLLLDLRKRIEARMVELDQAMEKVTPPIT